MVLAGLFKVNDKNTTIRIRIPIRIRIHWSQPSKIRKKPIPDPGFRGPKGTGSRMRNNFFFKYFISLMRIRDPGWKLFGSGIQDGNNSNPGWKKVGSGIRIRHKHPESASLLTSLECKVKKPQNTYHIEYTVL
jgi:hypothetical protein